MPHIGVHCFEGVQEVRGVGGWVIDACCWCSAVLTHNTAVARRKKSRAKYQPDRTEKMNLIADFRADNDDYM